jgi:hypothetical protein
VKEFLSQHQVPFAALSLTEDVHRRQVMGRPRRSSPLTLIGDEEVQGYNPAVLLAALQRAGLVDGAPTESARPAVATRPAPLPPLGGSLAVANFLDDSLTLLDARHGGYLGRTPAASTLPLAGRPTAVETCPQAGTFVTVNAEGGSVTFFSLEDGAFLHGDYERSTRRSGEIPLYAKAHPSEPLVYVSNTETIDGDYYLTVFDPVSGDYAFGGLENSRVWMPGQPGMLALHAAEDILYVRLRAGGVTMLRARTLQPLRGDLEASTFPTGSGRGVALSADGRVLYVPETLGVPDALALYDALSGRPLFGSREDSVRPTQPIPLGLGFHPTKPIVYVSCIGPQVIELRDGRTGDYLHGTAERSSIPVGPGTRALVVDPRDDILYAASFDESTVVMLDAETGADRFGDRAASTLAIGRGPRGMCLL